MHHDIILILRIPQDRPHKKPDSCENPLQGNKSTQDTIPKLTVPGGKAKFTRLGARLADGVWDKELILIDEINRAVFECQNLYGKTIEKQASTCQIAQSLHTLCKNTQLWHDTASLAETHGFSRPFVPGLT